MRATIAGLALIVGVPATAQAPSPPGQEPQARIVRRAAAPPVRVEGRCAALAMQLVNHVPSVEVTIGGRGPYRFAIDTGAQGHGRISRALAATLGLATIGEARTPAPGGAVETRPIYAMPAIGLGGMSVHEAGFVALSSAREPDAAWDGILGMDLFAALTLTIDYRNNAVVIGDQPSAGGAPASFERGIPSIPIEIAGRRFQVDLDTGNGAGALFLTEAAARGLPLAGEPVARGRARTSFGEFAIMEAPLSVPVTVGGFALPFRSVGWPSARGEGNLGSRGLAGTVLQVDRRNSRVRISAPAAPPACG